MIIPIRKNRNNNENFPNNNSQEANPSSAVGQKIKNFPSFKRSWLK
jgi:hypothetical protein